MTPVVHTSAGILGWHLSEKIKLRYLFLFILVSNLPDTDFIPLLIFGKAAPAHQLYTHNIFFSIAGALIFFPLIKETRARVALMLTSISHLIFDLCVIDSWGDVGFRLFWPVTEKLYNFGFFFCLKRGTMSDVFSLHNLITVSAETVLITLPILIISRNSMKTLALNHGIIKGSPITKKSRKGVS